MREMMCAARLNIATDDGVIICAFRKIFRYLVKCFYYHFERAGGWCSRDTA
jgi:hypothetical protein